MELTQTKTQLDGARTIVSLYIRTTRARRRKQLIGLSLTTADSHDRFTVTVACRSRYDDRPTTSRQLSQITAAAAASDTPATPPPTYDNTRGVQTGRNWLHDG